MKQVQVARLEWQLVSVDLVPEVLLAVGVVWNAAGGGWTACGGWLLEVIDMRLSL